jgi:uncharacterized protein YyaL (SSP411 family)
MLYDQSGLIRVLSKFGLLNSNPLVFDALFDTLEYLSKEMQSESGSFFASQDADTEGEEGIYFTFSEKEFEDLLEKDESLKKQKEKLKNWFGILPDGNFEHGQNVISLEPEFRGGKLSGKFERKFLRKEEEEFPRARIPKGSHPGILCSCHHFVM